MKVYDIFLTLIHQLLVLEICPKLMTTNLKLSWKCSSLNAAALWN